MKAAGLLLLLELASASTRLDRLPIHAKGGSLGAELAAEADADRDLVRRLLGDPSWDVNRTSNYKTSLREHFNSSDASTYLQRFFFDTSFCGSACSLPSTPIVCEMTGEWTASGTSGGALAELAASLGALMVTLEHRAYGCSQLAGGCSPPADARANIQFLTVEQAVEDSAAFVQYFEAFAANSFKPPSTPVPALTLGYKPLRKWAIAGGSYAGAFVSWVTVRHGDLFTATWASSGVVEAIYEFSSFDAVVAEAVGDDCANALRAVTDAFELFFLNRSIELYALFNASATGPTALTQSDFAWMLADSAGMGPQYGAKSTLCRYLNSTARDTPTSLAPPNPGFFLRDWDALVGFAQWTAFRYGVNFGSSCYYSTACLASNPSAYSDTTTWVLQCCNELAYWNVNSPGGTRSSRLTTSYFMSQCAAMLGPSVVPDTASFNGRFGGAKPLVSNSSFVFATQGSDDPWKAAGVQATISPNYLESTATCSGCSHCRDLSGSNANDPPAISAQRAAVLAQMKAWMVGSPPSSPASSASSLSGGAIAGIAVGTSIALIAAGFVGLPILARVWSVFRADESDVKDVKTPLFRASGEETLLRASGEETTTRFAASSA
jgi:hypothetical protein